MRINLKTKIFFLVMCGALVSLTPLSFVAIKTLVDEKKLYLLDLVQSSSSQFSFQIQSLFQNLENQSVHQKITTDSMIARFDLKSEFLKFESDFETRLKPQEKDKLHFFLTQKLITASRSGIRSKILTPDENQYFYVIKTQNENYNVFYLADISWKQAIAQSGVGLKLICDVNDKNCFKLAVQKTDESKSIEKYIFENFSRLNFGAAQEIEIEGKPVFFATQLIPNLDLITVITWKEDAFSAATSLIFKKAVILLLFAFGLALFISTFFARRMTTRLTQLAFAANQFSNGEKNIPLPEISNDEIGDLTRTFEVMIHEVKSSQTKAIQAEKLSIVGEMSAGIAHEMSNPLMVIKGSLKRIGAVSIDAQGQDHSRDIDRLAKGVDRLSKLCDQIKAFVYQTGGESTQVLFSVNNLVDDAIEFIKIYFQETDTEIILEKADFNLNSFGDPSMLQQVLLNFAKNANEAISESAKFNESSIEKPNVTIKTFLNSDNKSVGISIRDNGPGIPDSVLEKLCTPFFTTKKRGVGTGLGLSTSKKIIEDHGGKLEIKSEFGHWTEFVILLPIANENTKITSLTE